MKVHEIAENLRRDYQEFINQDRHSEFFVLLADYMSYVMNAHESRRIVESVMREKKREYDELSRLEDASLRELEEAEKKLLKIIKNSGISPDLLKARRSVLPGFSDSVLDLLKGYKRGRIGISGFKSNNINQFLFDIAVGVAKHASPEQLKEFIVSDKQYREYTGSDGNEDGNFIFSKTLPARWRKTEALENAKRTALWSAFDHLLKFREAFAGVSRNADNDEILRSHNAPCRNAFEESDAVDVVFAAEDVRAVLQRSEARDNDLHYLSLSSLRTSAKRVHGHLMRELSHGPESRVLLSPTAETARPSPEEKATAVKKQLKAYEQASRNNDVRIQGEKAREQKTSSNKGDAIASLIVIEPPDDHEQWLFVVNENYENAKPIYNYSRKGGNWSVIIQAIKAHKDSPRNPLARPPYRKAVFDYFNSNKKCAIYQGGKYVLTKILEKAKPPQEDQYRLKIADDIKTEIITHNAYNLRKRKQRSLKET